MYNLATYEVEDTDRRRMDVDHQPGDKVGSSEGSGVVEIDGGG